MGELLLVRHGFAGSNRDGIASCTPPGEGLTAEGIEQARALAPLLASEDISLAVTSRFARTKQTLELALDGRDVPIEIVPDIDEIHFGSFDGGLLETYRAWAASTAPGLPPAGAGESRAQAAARFARGLRSVLERPGERILLVGHALAIRYWVDAADGLVPAARMAPVAHASPYRLTSSQAERAADVLDAWSRAPAFRDPPSRG